MHCSHSSASEGIRSDPENLPAGCGPLKGPRGSLAGSLSQKERPVSEIDAPWIQTSLDYDCRRPL